MYLRGRKAQSLGCHQGRYVWSRLGYIFFVEIWSWSNIYGHSRHSTAVVSYWWIHVHLLNAYSTGYTTVLQGFINGSSIILTCIDKCCFVQTSSRYIFWINATSAEVEINFNNKETNRHWHSQLWTIISICHSNLRLRYTPNNQLLIITGRRCR